MLFPSDELRKSPEEEYKRNYKKMNISTQLGTIQKSNSSQIPEFGHYKEGGGGGAFNYPTCKMAFNLAQDAFPNFQSLLFQRKDHIMIVARNSLNIA